MMVAVSQSMNALHKSSAMGSGKLYLVSGKMAAGKSTLATRLAREHNGLLLREDDLLARLFPDEVTGIASYVTYSNRLKEALEPHLKQLIQAGNALVLDFPANTPDQRRWLFGLADNNAAITELHYLDCSDCTCKARLAYRAAAQPERAATDTIEMFDAMTKYFVPPSNDEGMAITIHHIPDQKNA